MGTKVSQINMFDEHEEMGLRKEFLKMLLSHGFYGSFNRLVGKYYSLKCLLKKTNFYNLVDYIPTSSIGFGNIEESGSDKEKDLFVSSLDRRWQKHIIPKTRSHILKFYDIIGQEVKNCKFMHEKHFTIDAKTNKIDGIFLSKKEIDDNWGKLVIGNTKIHLAIRSIPLISAVMVPNNKDYYFFEIEGFNDELREASLTF